LQYNWYHSIALPGGVVTPGMFDTRDAAKKIGMPQSLAGKRCLDVGTSDGFWAFEMERRGASQVVAIDLGDDTRADVTVGAISQIPGGASRQSKTFALAHKMLDSKVEWRDLSAYDVSPEELGRFDFVFMGSLLFHLRDPIKALMAVHSVVQGELLSYEPISPVMTLFHPRMAAARFYGLRRADWWLPNVVGYHHMVRAAGFNITKKGGLVFVGRRRDPGLFTLRHPFLTVMLVTRGIPQTWVLAAPQ
jgi:tRNA (mo5U34)-methyltransferase